ncbi:MAG: FHA domain-containing protein [Oscillospiraceae bacterium]|nr:FHA domain-containing protein [Oscillospiraceae bacterium]
MNTEERSEHIHIVPIEQDYPSIIRALFDRQIAGMVPVDIHVEAQGIEQRYSTEGLTDFRAAVAAWPAQTILQRLSLLCGEIQSCPLLIGESLRLFTEDKLFWDESGSQWRFLLLAAEGPIWSGMTDHGAQALWRALLVAAQEANPQAAPLLQQAVDLTAQESFSISGLRQLLNELAARSPEESEEPVSAQPAAEETEEMETPAPEAESEPAIPEAEETALPEPEPQETPAFLADDDIKDPGQTINDIFDKEGFFAPEKEASDPEEASSSAPTESNSPDVSSPISGLIDPEAEDMEYRPWESGQTLPRPNEAEIGNTGEPEGTAAVMEKLQDFPEQPRIPGKEPPPGPAVEQPIIAGREPPKPPKPTRLNSTDNLGKTTVLGQAPQDDPPPKTTQTSSGIPHIVRKRTNELAYIDRSTFVIGSKRGGVDFLVQNNPAISRRHAAIITRRGSYFLKDMGSSNGVFLRGQRLQRNQETPLSPGSSFTLADEEFLFQC